MKKLLMILCVGVLLCGCASSVYDIEISNGKQELLSYGKMTITKQDYFEVLLAKYGAQTIIENALTDIAKKEITDTDALNELVESKKKTYAEYYKGNIDDVAKANGYSDTKEYIEKIIVPQAYLELLNKKYVNEHYDSLIKENKATRFKVILTSKESEAYDIIEKTKKDFDKFNALMKESEGSEDVDIITKNSALDTNIINILDELSTLKKDQVYNKAIKLSSGYYAVLYIYDTERKDKQEWVDALINDTVIVQSIEGHYLKQYNFNVYEDKLSETIKSLSSQYLE